MFVLRVITAKYDEQVYSQLSISLHYDNVIEFERGGGTGKEPQQLYADLSSVLTQVCGLFFLPTPPPPPPHHHKKASFSWCKKGFCKVKYDDQICLSWPN